MDNRTRRDKLAAMAAQSAASPREAEIAQRILDALPAPRTLSRADILGAPDLRAEVRSRRFWSPSLRVYVVADEDDALYGSLDDWDGRD